MQVGPQPHVTRPVFSFGSVHSPVTGRGCFGSHSVALTGPGTKDSAPVPGSSTKPNVWQPVCTEFTRTQKS